MTQANRHHSVTEIESDCAEVVDKNGRETVVRLSLYAVLGFLVLVFSISYGFLFNANIQRDKDDRLLRERVIVLESKFDVISSGIIDLKSSMNEATSAIRALERSKGK